MFIAQDVPHQDEISLKSSHTRPSFTPSFHYGHDSEFCSRIWKYVTFFAAKGINLYPL